MGALVGLNDFERVATGLRLTTALPHDCDVIWRTSPFGHVCELENDSKDPSLSPPFR
jgi:hypothetical protein